jgi:preprotein translocase subunit SecF
MSLRRRLYSGNPGFDFRRVWAKALVISGVIVLACVASLAVRNLNLGIDFRGGGVWEVPSADLSVEATRDALRPLGHDNARIQVVTSGTDTRSIRVQADVDAVDDSAAIVAALAEAANAPTGEVSINTVGPTWGDEITGAAQRALVFFFIAIAAYISLRLEWRMAVAALVAVVHDIIVTVGLYSVFQFSVTPATVIAFLTILGYSLYDTVVVFDKVKESEFLVGTSNKMTYTDMANYATNEVFMRSVNTSVTSLLPILSMLFVGSIVLGATTLQEFAIALAIGLLVGAYSSLFVAMPVLIWLKEREPEMAEVRTKLGGARSEAVKADEVATMAAAGRRTIEARERERERATSKAGGQAPRPVVAAPTPRVTPTMTHPPRPRKKGKKR